jgi:microcystin-dependent protein
MSDPFVAEIRIFAGNFAPRGWAFCSGQLLPISQNTALFSLLGTSYGGDGRITFALPNLQGRAPMFWGQGPGLTGRVIGETGGESSVTLISAEMPVHTHSLGASTNDADTNLPGNAVAGVPPAPLYRPDSDTTMAPTALAPVGGGQPHNNMQPYLGLSFIIALQGVYPPRS